MKAYDIRKLNAEVKSNNVTMYSIEIHCVQKVVHLIHGDNFVNS